MNGKGVQEFKELQEFRRAVIKTLAPIFENRLPESTSLHWHGLEVPIEQDGVPWISQKPTAPGEKSSRI